LVQFISKMVTALTLYFGAHLVIQGQLTVGELIAFNMLAGRVAQPVLRSRSFGKIFTKRAYRSRGSATP
jgi:ABC-type bacteriocin/lantibiotic exporter with double-glycine peptidase domain